MYNLFCEYVLNVNTIA